MIKSFLSARLNMPKIAHVLSLKFLISCSIFFLAYTAQTQTIPPPYINYQAILYDVNGPNPNAPYALQSFPAYVNFSDELGNLLYREEHYSSTDANGQVTIKIGDGLYLAGPITNFNQIPWETGKYYLVVEFDINGTISATAPEQLVTVPYAFYAGNSGSGISSIADNGNGTLTFTYNNGGTYTTPVLSGLTGPQGPSGPSGPAGAPGPQGPNGLNALIKTTAEAAGANCTNGGTKIETGLDVNANGALDIGEVNSNQTVYVCNGGGGSNGSVIHDTWSSNQSSSFIVPAGVTSVIANFRGASAGAGGSATFIGNFTYSYGGGAGGSSTLVKLLMINLNQGDVITFDNNTLGANSTVNVTCYSCGTGCNTSCSGGSGQSSNSTNLYVNGVVVATISGASGGGGGVAGYGISNGGNTGPSGNPGQLSFLANGVVVLNQSSTTGNSSLSIEY